jgi:hypothetical protein
MSQQEINQKFALDRSAPQNKASSPQFDGPPPTWPERLTPFTPAKAYPFSQKAATPAPDQQREPNYYETHHAQVVHSGGSVKNDMYSYLGSRPQPTGFTNKFLESRDQSHFFDVVYKDFDLFEKNPGRQNIEREMLKGYQEAEPVSIAFFSAENVANLKILVCNVVAKQTNGLYRITPEAQSSTELLVVMRSIYLSNAKQLPTNIQGQVQELNYAVILDLVPRVLKNIEQRLGYIRDESSQPLTMERPQNLSSAGMRSANNASVTRTFI